MVFEDNFIFPIYINEETITEIIALCKNIENEIFGYLIGSILK